MPYSEYSCTKHAESTPALSSHLYRKTILCVQTNVGQFMFYIHNGITYKRWSTMGSWTENKIKIPSRKIRLESDDVAVLPINRNLYVSYWSVTYRWYDIQVHVLYCTWYWSTRYSSTPNQILYDEYSIQYSEYTAYQYIQEYVTLVRSTVFTFRWRS